MAVNTMDYNSKDLMLDVVRTERAKFFNIVDDPKNWKVQTRASEWKVQDMVGHMIDVTEGYLERWDMARKGEPAGSLGLQVMGDTLNKNAQALRKLPREEAIARLKADSDKMLTVFDSLTLKNGVVSLSPITSWVHCPPSSTQPSTSWIMASTPGT